MLSRVIDLFRPERPQVSLSMLVDVTSLCCSVTCILFNGCVLLKLLISLHIGAYEVTLATQVVGPMISLFLLLNLQWT